MLALPLLLSLGGEAHAQAVLAQPTVNIGRLTRLSVTGVPTGQLVTFTASLTGLGAGPCPTPTVCADTLSPIVIGQARGNAAGEAWMYIAISPQTVTAGQTVWFQAFPRIGARLTETNVTSTVVVQPPYTRCYDPGPDAPVLRVPQVTTTTFENKNLVYYMPANPRGVIFYFHGGEDGAFESLNPEQTAFLFNQMGINENFGIVALDRNDMRPGQSWDTTTGVANNPDAQRVNRLRNFLVANTGMNNNTPIILSGFSDGAGFSTTFANHAITTFGWPVEAATPHNGAFGDTPRIDTLFTLGDNEDPGPIAGHSGMVADMNRAGTPNVTRTPAERVVASAQFLREPLWETSDGDAVIADMRAFGLIDAQGRRLVADSQIESSLSNWQANSTLPQATIGEARVRVLWSTHRVTAFDNQFECDFIRDRIP